MKVVVGSNNPVKLEATKEAFARFYPSQDFDFATFSAPSGVSDQPMGHQETKQGAENRAEACRGQHPEANFWVGLEGGLEKIDNEYWSFACMCVIGTGGGVGFGRTGSFLLPSRISELIDQGEELGTAHDIVLNDTNSKQKSGLTGALTNEKITRKDSYVEALIFALIPFGRPDLYTKQKTTLLPIDQTPKPHPSKYLK